MGRLVAPLALALVLAAGSAAGQTNHTPAPAAGGLKLSPGQTRADWVRCLSRFDKVGLPRLRSEDARAEQFGTVICRTGYALSFNTRTLNPDWVMERLSPKELRGKAARSNTFAEDVVLDTFSPKPADYTRSGYDRGHQAPAADAAYDQKVMNDSFKMSNMSPQVGIGFNRGQWKYLEEAVRAWVLCGGHNNVVVFTGPIYGDSTTWLKTRPILVPAAYYKIVYDIDANRAVGFKLENKPHAKTSLQKFIVPISRIEDDTGIDFFTAFTRRQQTQLEEPEGILWGHDQDCRNAD